MYAIRSYYAKFYGEDYVQHRYALTDLTGGTKTDSSYFRFYPHFKESGYYEVFTKYPYSVHQTAQYNISHNQGITTKYKNQRNFCNESYNFV